MDVAQIGKHLAGIGHVLIDVVEVGDEQLSPTVEVVERFVDARRGCEYLVQVAHQFDGVGGGERGVLLEELANGEVGGAPDGLLHLRGEALVHEERCSLVGEDDGDACQVLAVFAEYVAGYIFKE